jgi:hypothetical protein
MFHLVCRKFKEIYDILTSLTVNIYFSWILKLFGFSHFYFHANKLRFAMKNIAAFFFDLVLIRESAEEDPQWVCKALEGLS